MSRSRIARVMLICVGLFLGLATQGRAQTGLNGAIDGTVLDAAGKPIANATVMLTGSKLMGTLTAVTEPTGEYHFPGLNPGPDYAMKFEANGFEPVSTKGVPVSIRATTAVNIHLNLTAAAREAAAVAANAANLVDSASGRTGQAIGSELTSETPKTDAFGVIAVAVGVVRDSPSVGGSTADLTQSSSLNGSSSNRYNVNGAETTAGAGNGRYGNFASYVETVVETAGANADVRRPGGGFQGDLVTKIGSNEFHGAANGAFYNSSFVGSNLNARLIASGLTETGDVKLLRDIDEQVGGPLLKDQAWFFIAGRHYHVERNVLGQTHEQVGDLNPGLNIAVDFKTNAHNRFQMYFGYDPKQDWERALDRTHDFNASGNQQAWSRTIQGKSWHTLGQRTVVESQFFYYTYWWPTYPQVGSGAPASNTSTGAFFQGETETDIQRHPERWEGSASITRNVSRFLGAGHEFKFGTDIGAARVHDITSFGNGGAFCVQPGNCSDADTVYKYKNDANGNQVPLNVTLDNGPIGPDRRVNEYTFYAADRMTAGRWTVNYGARYDTAKDWRPAQCQNSNARWVLAGVFQAECFPEADTLKWNNVSPRVSATYKLTDDERTLIKGSFGLYPAEMIPETSDPVNPNTNLTNTYVWLGDLNGNGRLDFPSEVGALTSTVRFKNNTFAPGYHAPQTQEQGIGFEKQLFGNIVFRTNYYYTRYTDASVTTNVGIPASAYLPVTITDPGASGIPNGPTIAPHPITVYNIDKSYVTNSVSVISNWPGVVLVAHSYDMTVQKRLSNGWQVLASYAYNHFPYVRTTDLNNLNMLINNRGVSPLETPNTVKVNGSYTFQRIGAQIGINYIWSQGQGFDRTLSVTGLNQGQFTIVADPPGTWTYDTKSQIDVKLTKNFNLGQGRRLGLSLDGYNLTNAAPVTQLGGAGINGLTGPAFGQVIHTTPPRTFRLGARFSF